jgi:hypothetical protein
MAKKVTKKASKAGSHSMASERKKHGAKHEGRESGAFERKERAMPGYPFGEKYGRKGR